MNTTKEPTEIEFLKKELTKHLEKPKVLPIESPETELTELDEQGFFKTSLLNQSYFDEAHRCHLPVFACADVESQSCEIETQLGFQCNITGQQLQDNLARIDYWDKSDEKMKEKTKRYSKRENLVIGILTLTVLPFLVKGTYKFFEVFKDTPTNMESLAFGIWVTFFASAVSSVLFVLMKGIAIQLRKLILKDTAENSSLLNKKRKKTFRCLLPGNLPKEIQEKIFQEGKHFHRIHLIWKAKGLWATKETKVTHRPTSDTTLMIGEHTSGKYHYLGSFDLVKSQ